MSDILYKAKAAKAISLFLSTVSTLQKNKGLAAMANALIEHQAVILSANEKDILAGRKAGMTESLIDRLSLSPARIKSMAEGLQIVIDLPDPVGDVIEGWTPKNGLNILKKRVPIGVIAIIYEARPNVTVDAAGLTLKSSNAVILRGSSSAIESNIALVAVLNDALVSVGFPLNTIQLIEDTSRETVKELVTAKTYVDLVIPRGGAGLIQTVLDTATVPTIETGIGNCHVYIDKDADPAIVEPIVINAKVQRPSVCNAAESLLIHADVADRYLPSLIRSLKAEQVVIVGCKITQQYDATIELATEDDYATEFLDYKIAIKVVKDVAEAIDHIARFGTRHTEAILSDNIKAIEAFESQVDAAAVIVNASTRFTDGFEFGFGSEIGISTQKIHARGPMGLRELTTYKYIVRGKGQIR